MKFFLRIVSVLIIVIGICYIYISICALLNVESIANKIISGSILGLPYQFLPELKENLIRNNIFILLFGALCIITGLFLFRKAKKFRDK